MITEDQLEQHAVQWFQAVALVMKSAEVLADDLTAARNAFWGPSTRP